MTLPGFNHLQDYHDFFSNNIGLKIRAGLGVAAIILIAGIVTYQINFTKKCLIDHGEYSIAQVIEVGPLKLKKRKRLITLRYKAMGQYHIRKISKSMLLHVDVGDKFKVKYCPNDPSLSVINFKEKIW